MTPYEKIRALCREALERTHAYPDEARLARLLEAALDVAEKAEGLSAGLSDHDCDDHGISLALDQAQGDFSTALSRFRSLAEQEGVLDVDALREKAVAGIAQSYDGLREQLRRLIESAPSAERTAALERFSADLRDLSSAEQEGGE